MSQLKRALAIFVLADTRAHQSRSWGESAAGAAVIVLTVLLLARGEVLGPPPSVVNNRHAVLSLEMAINHRACGKYGYRDSREVLFQRLLRDLSDVDTPLLGLPAELAGSREAYCATVTKPSAMNEISLMFTMDGILRVWPRATWSDVGLGLRALRLGALALLVLALVRSGVSGVFAGFLFYVCVIVVRGVEREQFYAVYPFMPVLVVGFPAILSLALHAGCDRKPIVRALTAVGVGLAAGFVYNMRTSYLPLVAVAISLFVWLSQRSTTPWRAVLTSLATLGMVVLGFLGFQRTVVHPLPVAGSDTPYTYHVVAHPLVLGLAVPENDFAKRHGIEWNDTVGLKLAQTVDPNVQYLAGTYERALFAFYARLWIMQTDEMKQLYLAKWRLVGREIGRYQVPPLDAKVFGLVRWPLRQIESGITLAVLAAALILAGVVLGRHWSIGGRLLWISLASSTLLLIMESAVILSLFHITHQSALMILLFMWSVTIYQAAVVLGDRLARGLIRRSAAPAPDVTPA